MLIQKYPRTRHIQGSRLQPGDEDLEQVPLRDLYGKHLVIEEKQDGANSGISFDAKGKLHLQSRGHILQGGPRETQFTLFKQWADKPDPARALILASLEVNRRDVAMLAMADVLGRECAGRSQLVESVEVFSEYCEELGCRNGPRQFEHDHHRFMYCVGCKPIDYVPYVGNDAAGEAAFEVILMSGLPGSGKTTVAHRIAGDRPIISLDQIRDTLAIDGGDNQSPVIASAREQAMALLRRRQSFIWDATNTTRDLRAGLIALFANYGATTRIVYVEPPSWQELFARNRNRQRPVPESVILRLAERLEIPSLVEAHRVEYVA